MGPGGSKVLLATGVRGKQKSDGFSVLTGKGPMFPQLSLFVPARKMMGVSCSFIGFVCGYVGALPSAFPVILRASEERGGYSEVTDRAIV